MSVVAPASRNAPCPCGSGRRYKDCHGRLAADARSVAAPSVVAPPRADPARDVLAQRMQEALAAQQAGRLDEAIARYGEVLDAAPDIYDAWHMRGVARFQALRYDDAERDILRAIEIAPHLPSARQNLALVRQGRYLTAAEDALCRAALPRFRDLVAEAPAALLDGIGPGSLVRIVVGAPADRALADVLRRAALGRNARVRLDDAGTAAEPDARDADRSEYRGVGRDSPGDGGATVLVGCGRPIGDALASDGGGFVALVADRDTLAALVDRLEEASGFGRRRVRVAVTADSPLDLAAVPHLRGGPW